MALDWQAITIGLSLLMAASVLGIVIRIAFDVHDATNFRRRHEDDIHLVAQQIRDLHSWHDVRDEDGVPSWYVRKSLEDKIEGLAQAIVELSKSIQNGHGK